MGNGKSVMEVCVREMRIVLLSWCRESGREPERVAGLDEVK
jgi:hypothetical protein